MNSVLADVQAHLPLTISTVVSDADGVLVGGQNWHLRVNTDWVLRESVQLTGLLLESAEEDAARRLGEIIDGHSVSGLGLQYHDSYGDAILVLDNGNVLEAVSDFPCGEWILSIWHEDDPKRLPVFDPSGPVE